MRPEQMFARLLILGIICVILTTEAVAGQPHLTRPQFLFNTAGTPVLCRVCVAVAHPAAIAGLRDPHLPISWSDVHPDDIVAEASVSQVDVAPETMLMTSEESAMTSKVMSMLTDMMHKQGGGHSHEQAART